MNKLHDLMMKIVVPSTTALTLVLSPHHVYAEGELGIKYTLINFLKFETIEDLLVGILNIFIVIATPIIVLFIIYAGFLYVTARGNAEQTQQATRALTYAIIGGVLIIGAVAITAIISNVVGSFIAES